MNNLQTVLDQYSLMHASIAPMTDTGRNNALWRVEAGGAVYILKQHSSPSYDDAAAIDYEANILNTLTQKNLSFDVPVLLANQHGDVACQTEEGWFSLMRHFPGVRVNAADLDHIDLFGSALGELHVALADVPLVSRPGRPLFEHLLDFSVLDVCALTPAQLGLDDPTLDDLFAWWRDEAQAVRHFVAGPYQSLPQQMCHNDITPNNVLINLGYVSAVLDFEFLSPAARALDVAMALRMTMRIWDNPEPWPIVERFFAGYRRWTHLTEDEIAALPLLLRLRSALPIVWWVGRQESLARVPSLMENQRTLVDWLAWYERPFLERVARWGV